MNFTPKQIGFGLLGFFIFCVIMGGWYTVPEGHVGIVKRFSQAQYQVDPGLHFKIPFIESVEEIEVRTRKNEEQMPSSTAEQMPLNVHVSVNWTVQKDAAFELFKKYGGLAQFESRVLDPRFRSATKAALPKFEAVQLIQDRNTAINLIESNLLGELEGFPVTIDNVQIENIVLPPKYVQSIETKQTEKNLADAEKHKLERQRLEALREVNTADAKAQGILKIAKAEAEGIAMKGEAEAKAIAAKGTALRNNPLLVELTQAESWDGKLPQTVLGNGAMPIMDLRASR